MAKTTKKAAAKTSKKKAAKNDLTEDQIEKLKVLGYDGDDAEEAKTFVMDFLKKNELEGTDDNDLDTLLEIASLFDPEEEDDEDAEDDEESDDDSEGDEEGDEDDDEEEEEDPDEDEDDEVEDSADDEEEDSDDDDEDESEDDDEESDDEAEEYAEEEEEKKPAKKVTTPAKKGKKEKTKRGDFVALDMTDKAHLKVLKPILDNFSDKKKFAVNNVSRGFTVYYLGDNNKITLFAYCRARIDVKNGQIIGAFNATRIKDVAEFVAMIPSKYREDNIGKFPGESNISYRNATNAAVADILSKSKFLKISIEKATSTDKKLGENRKKLEASLAKEKKGKIDKKTAKKAAAAPKATKKTDKKVTAKKATAKKKK